MISWLGWVKGFRNLCFAKSAGLRLPFRSARPVRYSTVHRTVELYAHALSDSNPSNLCPDSFICFTT
jgi:hypothetical protein